MAHLAPILIHGYSPPAASSNPRLTQFAALDDVFARYPVLTIIHILAIFFATSTLSGLTPYDFFGPGFWIGFALHLIAAEVWIRRTRPQTTALPVGGGVRNWQAE